MVSFRGARSGFRLSEPNCASVPSHPVFLVSDFLVAWEKSWGVSISPRSFQPGGVFFVSVHQFSDVLLKRHALRGFEPLSCSVAPFFPVFFVGGCPLKIVFPKKGSLFSRVTEQLRS